MKESQLPLFSIVLPIYNVEKYIERCLTSIQVQLFKSYELIFVNDHGQDKSLDKVLSHAKGNPKVNVVHNPKNLGTFHARRKGVESAQGKYIVFLDPDDELAPDFLAKLAKHIEVNRSDLIFYDIQHLPKKRFYQPNQQTLPFYNSERVLQAIQKYNGKKVVWAGTSGKVFSRTILLYLYEKLDVKQDFRYVYTEDKLLYYAALLENPSYSVLAYKGYIYHNNDTSITNQKQLTAPSFLIEQLEYTTGKLKELVAHAELTEKDKKFFTFFLNECVQNQIMMMRRYEDNGENYLHYVWSAFKEIPDVKQLIRVGLYLFSFKQIRV